MIKKISLILLFLLLSYLIIVAIVILPKYIDGRHIIYNHYTYVKQRIRMNPDFTCTQVRYSDNLLIISYIQALLCVRNDNYILPIFLALKDEKMLKLMLDNGADPNVENVMRMTPLDVAVKLHCFESINILLENGADPNFSLKKRGDDALTPLGLAKMNNDDEVIELLLRYGALHSKRYADLGYD